MILTKSESSKSCIMYGLTMAISSHIGLLQGIAPLGKIMTLVPVAPLPSSRSSNFILLLWPYSSEWLSNIGSGMGTFSSWWTFVRFLLLKWGVAKSSLSLTIFSGKPFNRSCSAWKQYEILYTLTNFRLKINTNFRKFFMQIPAY